MFITSDIEENGVRLRLTVVDTPGFGDFVNNDDRRVIPLIISSLTRTQSIIAGNLSPRTLRLVLTLTWNKKTASTG